MSNGEDVTSLLQEIKKELDRSASLLNLRILENDDFDIPEDISRIQNLHDVVVQDLADLKKNLENHTSIIENTELIMNILDYKLYELQFGFRNEIEQLRIKKESLTKLMDAKTGDSQTAVRFVELDEEITKLEDTHQTNIDSIKEQKLEAQKSYERAVVVMDENFDKMTKGFNKLLVLIEAEKATMTDFPSELVDSKFENEINQIGGQIEEFTALQTAGWKVLVPEEKLSELLQERGLKILRTGELVTGEGQAMSFKDAMSKGLDDLKPEVLKEIKGNLQNTPLSSTTSTNSSTSIKMSSDDVNYLKDYLGKPLALALAEITTIQPRDPIHYLGHWLFKYRYNQQMEDVNLVEVTKLTEMRNKLAKERWHKFIEEEARAAVIDMVVRAEEIGIMHELQRIQDEAEAMEEMEELDYEARDVLGTYNGPPTGQVPL